jgi:hypothetical protein
VKGPRSGRGDVSLLVLAAVVTTWSIIFFPAVAVLLRRRLLLLWSATGIALCLILWFAVFAAGVPTGVLPAEYGYSRPLPRSLLLHGLTLGPPQIAATVVVRTLAGRLSSRLGLYFLSPSSEPQCRSASARIIASLDLGIGATLRSELEGLISRPFPSLS